MYTNAFLKGDILFSSQTVVNVCVSIIIPLDNTSGNNRANLTVLYGAVAIAKKYLADRCTHSAAKRCSQYLDELIDNLPLIHNAIGIGLFVSDQVKFYIPFVFPVTEKVIVSDSLELREVLYQISYSQNYMLLYLTGEEAMLFKGNLNMLKEIKDKYFPVVYKNVTVHTWPAVTQFRSKAGIKEYQPNNTKTDYESFLKEIDESLSAHLDGRTKVILAGITKNLKHYKQITRNANSIIGEFSSHNNNEQTDAYALSNAALCAIYMSVDMQKQQAVNNFEKLLKKNQAITGLQEIWYTVMNGRGHKLILEKDYEHVGFLTLADNNHLYLKPPSVPYSILTNVIDNLIKAVIRKKGEVILVENGLLAKYQRIGLVTY